MEFCVLGVKTEEKPKIIVGILVFVQKWPFRDHSGKFFSFAETPNFYCVFGDLGGARFLVQVV